MWRNASLRRWVGVRHWWWERGSPAHGRWRSASDTTVQFGPPTRPAGNTTATSLVAPHLQTSQQVSAENYLLCNHSMLTLRWNQHTHAWNLYLFVCISAAAAAKFRRDSLFCPDELDSLFSYFDTGSGPRSKSTTQLPQTNVMRFQDYWEIGGRI